MSKVDDAIHSLTHIAQHSDVTVVRAECAQAADVLRELAERVAEQDKVIARGQAQIDGIYDTVIDTFEEHDDKDTVIAVKAAVYWALGVRTTS